ncbi:MAG TPA: acyl-CoA dehydrogenase [Thermoanaerobaculia bacterium]|nr:acyl-CoA dehydrogenase [Thermoanaerobaculia bacterium]
MAQTLADRRDVEFVLYEQLNADQLAKHEAFADFNRKAIDMLISEARNLALREILPTQKDGDRIGVRFDNGKVTVPESFHKAWKALLEGEWVATTEDPEWGGQGMPRTVAVAAADFLQAANFAFLMYANLSHGAGKLIQTFGTDKQKKLFLKKLYSGEWTGTMLLTEPGAGSDVGALTTTATPNEDGTYSIVGNKIFISGGEHDLAENIIHPVLARIEGAPAGTAGISLFIVPKIWVNDDGTLGEPNDVVCTGIEEKMGIHGNSTCSISLGSRGKCRGLLLGEPHKGMRAMFLMMNDARLMVANQALGCASAAYLYALDYARNRIQGRHLMKMLEREAPGVPIIQHPDVRRMLMIMKVYVESLRSLNYYVANCIDRIALATDPEEKKRLQGIVDFLIPIAKAYSSERSVDVCNLGIQVYGGYGYIREYPMEQLLRDCRITPIYEGTNGIQAMDLLGRKLGMNGGRPILDLADEIRRGIAEAAEVDRTSPLAEKFEQALVKLEEVARHIGTTAMYGNLMAAAAHAHPFLEVCGDMVAGWMLLWRARIAAQALGNGAKEKDKAFYEGQIRSAEFYANNLLPVALGRMDSILNLGAAAVEICDESFGGH